MHELTDIVWRHQEDAIMLPRQKSVPKLAALLDSDPSLDGPAVARIVESDLGLVVPRTVSMVGKANRYLKLRPPVDLDPIRDRVRLHKLQHLEAMEKVVLKTKHLRRVLDSKWFDEVRAVIGAWDAASVFSIPTHPAYMGYYDDSALKSTGTNLIVEIDDAFDLILPFAGKLTTKIHQIGSSTENYVPAVFEALIVARLARAGFLREYEPVLPGGGKAEARIEIAGQNILVEARSKVDEDRGSGGAFNPYEMGKKLHGKIRKKYAGQYAAIGEPLVLFFSLDAGVIQDIEPEAAITKILRDPKASTLSAVVFSDTYRGRNMWFWRNPRARHRLTRTAVACLRSVLNLKQFRRTGIV
jgi:hypothetical protein